MRRSYSAGEMAPELAVLRRPAARASRSTGNAWSICNCSSQLQCAAVTLRDRERRSPGLLWRAGIAVDDVTCRLQDTLVRASANQGSYHPGRGHLRSRESAQVTRIGSDHLACRPILAVVPPCAGECRLVRVTGVLIFVNGRTCVAFVLLPAGPLNHRGGARLRAGWPARGHWRTAATTHQPARRPAASGAMLGITYRD
jgi:hypothetical protein